MITQKELDTKIPDGMEVVGAKFLCDRHGDVTEAVLKIPYTVIKKGETEPTTYEHFFCIQCLAECFSKLADEGKIGKLTLERQVATHEDAEKLREKLAEAKKTSETKVEKSNEVSSANEEQKVDSSSTKEESNV